MKEWWHESSKKQKFLLLAILLLVVNCTMIFGFGVVNRGLWVGNFVAFGLAIFYPSEYDD